MGTSELFKAFAVLVPIVGLVSLGLLICLVSGGAGLGRVRDLRRLAGNLSRAALVFGAGLLGLATIQQLVGFRMGLIG